MELLVQKWGKSAAVRLPSDLLSVLKVSLGDKLSVTVQPDGVLLNVARPSFSLADLVAQCDLTAPEPADMNAWASMECLGRETNI